MNSFSKLFSQDMKLQDERRRDYNSHGSTLPSGLSTDEQKYSQSGSFMQIAKLNSQSQYKATNEHHIGILHL